VILRATRPNPGRTGRMKTTILGFMMLVVVPTAGCGSEGGEGSSAQVSEALVEACSGTIKCSLGSESFQEQLERRDGACYLGGAKVVPDGTMVGADGSSLTWEGNIFKFDLCSDGTCLTCTNLSPPDVPGYACRGASTSCSDLGAGSCATQSGCSFTIGATLSSYDDKCYGSADSCSEFKSTSECEWQHGCYWSKE
jgi:hypothetical protein